MIAPHLYVHVPFCSRRCSYCSFAIAVRSPVPDGTFVDHVLAELALRFPERSDEPLRTLYLGGGTPSHLGAAGLAALVERIRARYNLATDAEVTLEANPEDVTTDAVGSWRDAGINRVSLGVQSFSDAALQWMHRVHDARAARSALRLLARTFSRISADLIFALPPGVDRNLVTDIRELLESGARHVSIYGLTVEAKTAYSRWIERGLSREAPEERYESEYLCVHDILGAAGFQHYEVSSFALPGHRSLHNSAYWSGAHYTGAGPAAHGYDGQLRRWNVAQYEQWRKRVAAAQDPIAESELLTHSNRLAEQVYLGMRTCDGLALTADEEVLVAPWLAAGWVTLSGLQLRLTALGWLRLDSLAAALTAHRSR